MIDRKSDRFSVDHLRTFLAVHRAGTLTEAARALGLAQGTVSEQVRALEKTLGLGLFERLPRGVTPTPAGDDLAKRVAAPLDALRIAVAGVTGELAHNEPQPPVRLGGPSEFLAAEALPALAKLAREGVRIDASVGLAEDLLQRVLSGRLDLAISTNRPRGRALRAEPLAWEHFVLVGAPQFARELARPADAQNLADIPLVAYAHDLPILRRYWRHVFATRLDAEPVLVIPDLRGVVSAVVAGAGISALPHYLCRSFLDSGALVELVKPDDPPTNTSYLVRRPADASRPNVALVYRTLLQASPAWR